MNKNRLIRLDATMFEFIKNGAATLQALNGMRTSAKQAPGEAPRAAEGQIQATPQAPEQRGIWGRLKSIIGIKSNPEAQKQGEEIVQESAEKRQGFFGEMMKSLLVRQFPSLTAWWEVAQAAMTATGLKDESPESYEFYKTSIMGKEISLGENEIETILAILQILPDSFKKILTDRIANIPYFNQFVEVYCTYLLAQGINTIPGIGIQLPEILAGNQIRDKIINDKDPDSIVTFLRIFHQDIVTGTTGARQLLSGLGIIKLNPGQEQTSEAPVAA